MSTPTCGEISCEECDNRTAALTAERDQLRARAERAEADLAALGQSFDDNCRGVVRIDADLAMERARLDWVFHNCKVTADRYTTGNRDVYAIHDREDLGAAMLQ